MSTDNLKIVSLNVRGLRDINKHKEIFNLMKKKNVSFAILSETHSCVDDIEVWSKQWGMPILWSHSSSQSRGVCILINEKYTHNIEVSDFNSNPHGRYIICTVKNADFSFILCGI